MLTLSLAKEKVSWGPLLTACANANSDRLSGARLAIKYLNSFTVFEPVFKFLGIYLMKILKDTHMSFINTFLTTLKICEAISIGESK